MATLSDWLSTKGLTDAEFGRRIGCDRGSVGRYTRGERYPDPATLLRIRQETEGEVTADDMLATWSAANPGRVPTVEPAPLLAAQNSTAAEKAA